MAKGDLSCTYTNSLLHEYNPMKALFRNIFSFILTPLESGDDVYTTQPSHRKILLIVGVLFCVLATTVVLFSPKDSLGFLFPTVVFYSMGAMSFIVGCLGNDKAVGKIWGSKSPKKR